MSVRFIIGRAGSGKTRHFLQRTIHACRADPLGDPILWIVPRQATFVTERDLCCSGELGGFFRVQVVSFDLLSREILTEVGGAADVEVTHRGRQMILGHLLRRHEGRLRFFRGVAKHNGLAAQVASALDELERSGTELPAIAAHASDPANSALADKLADLVLIQSAYGEFLGKQRLDPQGRLRQAMDAMPHSRRLAAATIYVDGFLHFTHAERRMVVGLARSCHQMEIALTMDTAAPVLGDRHQMPDEMSLFHRMETEYRSLHFAFDETGIKVDKPLLLTEAPRFQSPALLQLEKWSPGDGAEGVERIEAPGKRAEVELAARRIRSWVAGGWRWRDVALLSRQISEYHDLIEAVFAEHGIPFFLDQRRTAAHHPLIQFVRATLDLAAEPWDLAALLTLAKCGLCGLSATEADELENALLLSPHRGGALAKLNHPLLTRLIDPLRSFVAASATRRTVGKWAGDILSVIEAFGIRAKLAAWIVAAGPEQAAEHQQVWAEIVELFDQLVDLLGEQVMDLGEFQSVLFGALEQFDLAIAPATVDQVLVGQVDRTRTPAIKGCIVLGLADGQFPLPSRGQSILSDADRRDLAGWLPDTEPDWRRRALDEEFLGYIAFTRASERLLVTRPTADEGARALAPSSLWIKLSNLLPASPLHAVQSPAALDAESIATPRQLIAELMQWARRDAADPQNASHAPLYQWLTTRPPCVDEVRAKAWSALSYANAAELSRDLAEKMFPAPYAADVRQLEMFAACPFQHFLRYGLKLSPRKVDAMDGQDIWRLSFEVLRNLGNGDESQLAHLVAAAARKLKGDTVAEAARNRHVLQRMTATLQQVLATRKAAQNRGEFKTAQQNLRYGEQRSMPALSIGNKLRISGEIDRIDTTPDAAVLHDYRLKTSAIRLGDVYHGLALELVVHLLAWEQSARRPKAVAVLASPLLRHLRDESPEDAPDPESDEFKLLPKARGLIAGEFIHKLDSQLAPGGKSAVIAAARKKDGAVSDQGSDVLTQVELAALLSHVRLKLQTLADDLIAGDIGIRPYRMGAQTPCARCSFIDVCRFDPADTYRKLNGMKRRDALVRLCSEHTAPEQGT